MSESLDVQFARLDARFDGLQSNFAEISKRAMEDRKDIHQEISNLSKQTSDVMLLVQEWVSVIKHAKLISGALMALGALIFSALTYFLPHK